MSNLKKNKKKGKKDLVEKDVRNLLMALNKKIIKDNDKEVPITEKKIKEIFTLDSCKEDYSEINDAVHTDRNNVETNKFNNCIDPSSLIGIIKPILNRYVNLMTKNIKFIKKKYINNESELHNQLSNIYSKLKHDLSDILSIYTVGEAEIFTSVVDDVSDVITTNFECKEGECKSNIEFNKKIQKCKNIINSSVDPDMRKVDNPDYLCNSVWNLNFINKADWGCKVPDKNVIGCRNLKTNKRNIFGIKRKASKIKNDNCDWGIKQCKGLSYKDCEKKNSAMDKGSGVNTNLFELAKSGEIKENETCEKYSPRPIPMCFKDGNHELDKPGDRWKYFIDKKSRIGGPEGKIYLKNCTSKKKRKKTKKDMKKWINERFGKISMEQKIKESLLNASSEYRDLIDDCMEGKNDRGARKSCRKRITLKIGKALAMKSLKVLTAGIGR